MIGTMRRNEAGAPIRGRGGLWLFAAALLPLLISANQAAHAQSAPAAACEADITVLPSPVAPWKGAPLRVIIASEKPFDGEFSLVAPDGQVAASSRERHGGPPYFWLAEVTSPAAGTWQATLTGSAECGTIKRPIAVRAEKPAPPRGSSSSIWPVRANWTRATENLFSAWVEKLFDDPLDTAPSWPALHEVLRDRSRNFLHNHLGLNEDSMKLIYRPDCADLPYFLRAYFAFKMGLPFGFSKCSRGERGAPKCFDWTNNVKTEPAEGLGLVQAFNQFVRLTVANIVHSGSGRTLANDNNTDYYPVPLTQDALRPGTVYADPYGHILMITRRVAQTADSAGLILAVDGQPDGTVARKRFWRGNFLFAQNPALGSAGFKRFRPIVRAKDGALRRLSNDEIVKNPHYGDFSLDQSRISVEDFYDRMDEVLSPAPLDPFTAMREAIAALDEQVKVRVTSVENGRKFLNSGRGPAEMPSGPAIFETTGAWEDFSTPSRDLRLLIAIDVVLGFPDRVARRSERYAMPRDKSAADVTAELQRMLASELVTRKFAYPRSDGSPWTLTLKDVADRAIDLEMAYNPNDCVELRWGAPAKSDEAATCKKYAPQAQRGKMLTYRAWFHERRRPPRA